MRLNLETRRLELEGPARESMERRVRFSLSRFADRLGWVTVRIFDENGPRGGIDKVCRIQAKVDPGRALVAEARDDTVEAAVDRAARKVARRVEIELEKRREHDFETLESRNPDSRRSAP